MKFFTVSTFKLFILTSLFSYCTFAQNIKTNISQQKYEEFKLAASTQYDDGTTKADLKAFSTGIRKKKAFGLVTVKVYHAELLLAKAENIKKEEDLALESLKAAGPIHLRLTMLRDLTGKQISDSFKEVLQAFDLKEENYSQELKDIFKEISGITEFKKGEVFSLAANWTDKKATLLIQKPDQQIIKISGSDVFATQLFQIWFGKPVDAKKIDPKLVDLKKELLKI